MHFYFYFYFYFYFFVLQGLVSTACAFCSSPLAYTLTHPAQFVCCSLVLPLLTFETGINYIEGSKGSVFFFDCNLLHGSHNNITPFPRANSFMVYNAVTNKLGPPLVGQGRPEYIATRDENWCKPIIPDRFHL